MVQAPRVRARVLHGIRGEDPPRPPRGPRAETGGRGARVRPHCRRRVRAARRGNRQGCRGTAIMEPYPVEYLIKQYGLQQGALEIQYIEEFFLDFPRKKTALEVMQRLHNRDHQILMAEAPLPDDPGTIVPVSFKVAHELRRDESDPKLADLVEQLDEHVDFGGKRVLYQWIGGTRSDW